MSSLIFEPGPLLLAAIKELGFGEGELLDSTNDPERGDAKRWLDKGGWLSLARNVGVSKIFFVDDDPTVVFAEFTSTDEEQKREAFNRIWCMARPRLLFLAGPGELEVLDLARKPIRRGEPMNGTHRLGFAAKVEEIAEKLAGFHRKKIESGVLFENEKLFGKPEDRADTALIRDLRTTRERLVSTQPTLKQEFAHAIIGRSIFVRYLEDRAILVRKYFYDVAEKHLRDDWKRILDAPALPDVDPVPAQSLYLKVLSDKEFTYALFSEIAHDFRGDIFPSDSEEEKAVGLNHLALLQRFLRGDTQDQPNLFFFAYHFEIIPIDLISSIYEEFYHVEAGKENQGSHYTPSTLVSFLLSQVLTEECLNKTPRVLDPAAGSGIFLVEAFRRMVRHRARGLGRLPDQTELTDILARQIAGIEINPEAVRVAAFSLYLALLHYQLPPDIQQKKRLPFLVASTGNATDVPRGVSLDADGDIHLDILLRANAFDIDRSASSPEQRDKLCVGFGEHCADVVIGNPPWGNLTEVKGVDREAQRAEASVTTQWCISRGLSVGDAEHSQAFIHRSLNLLKENGTAGLLVSSGVLFKQGRGSQEFRQQWLAQSALFQVVNFAHVREVFFSKGIAPFVSVVFSRCSPDRTNNAVSYWSAKETAFVRETKAIVLRKPDLHVIEQQRLMLDDRLWKIYWWGGQRDEMLIRRLDMELTLVEHEGLLRCCGSGFKAGGNLSKATHPDHWIWKYEELPTASIDRYGPKGNLTPLPTTISRVRGEELYNGLRLLVKHGPAQAHGSSGQIIARLEKAAFGVRHSVYIVGFEEEQEESAKIILGILWSSLARYYLFLTASSWGTWHHKISLNELRDFPIRLPVDKRQANGIVKIVDALREGDFHRSERVKTKEIQGEFDPEVFTPSKQSEKKASAARAKMEEQLDTAIFDLYQLDVAERDQVRDMCRYGLSLFYAPKKGEAVKPALSNNPPIRQGRLHDLLLPETPQKQKVSIDHPVNEQFGVMGAYLRAFLLAWQPYLKPGGSELAWEILQMADKTDAMMGILFTLVSEETVVLPPVLDLSTQGWTEVFSRFGEHTQKPLGTDTIYIDGLVRLVSDSHLLILKRNVRRLWSASQGREDANATIARKLHVDAKTAITSN